MLQKAFDSVGYNTLVAYTLEEGLLLFEQSSPDLLLLDINLPDKPGPVACKEIKANPRFNATSVILMSGSYEDYIKQQVAESGADGYIKKPFSPSSILQWVKDNSHLLFNDITIETTTRQEPPISTNRKNANQISISKNLNKQSPVEKVIKTYTPTKTPVAGMLEQAVPLKPYNSGKSNIPKVPEIFGNTEKESEKQPQTTQSDSDFWGRDLSIVITDDSTFLCSILKDTLEKVGFKVNTFPNIRETGLYLRANKADLLFLDINLPDISGHRACQIIKDSPITSNLPVVLISGAQEEQLRKLTEESGANGFITKPFTPMTVLNWLKQNGYKLFPNLNNKYPHQPTQKQTEAQVEETENRIKVIPDSAVTILTAQLSSKNKAVQLAACYSLGEYKARQAVDKLTELLMHTDPEISGEAAWALGEIHSTISLNPIRKLLNSDNQWLKGRAIEAMGKIGNASTVKELSLLFNPNSQELKIAIIKAVGLINSEKSLHFLRQWSLDRDKDVAANAKIMINIIS